MGEQVPLDQSHPNHVIGRQHEPSRVALHLAALGGGLGIGPEVVVGYHSLASASVTLADAPPTVAEGIPQAYAVPVVLLARLAVDRNYQSG